MISKKQTHIASVFSASKKLSIPSGAAKGKMFKMYQKETIKLSEPEKQKDKMNEVATITTYKDVPYIKFN